MTARSAMLVVANPSPGSFSHAMAAAASAPLERRGYDIKLHDLYAERFDPVQRTGELGNAASQDSLVERHCAELASADLVLVFHPNWWGQAPAILIDALWRRCIFGLCGVTSVIRRMYSPIAGSSAAQRNEWLVEVSRIAADAA